MLKKIYECFLVLVEDKVVYIVLNCLQVMNVMNKVFWNELFVIVNEIDVIVVVCVIVILFEGKYFLVGMDILVFGQDGVVINGKVDCYVVVEVFCFNIKQIQFFFNVFEDVCIFVLIVCQGGVIGGVIDMIFVCDICWCMMDVFFCIVEINIVMMVDVGIFLCL